MTLARARTRAARLGDERTNHEATAEEEYWEKKYRIMSKKLIFGETYRKFTVAMAISKIVDTQLTGYNFADNECAAPESFSPSE